MCYEMDAKHVSQSMTAQPAPPRANNLVLKKKLLANTNEQLRPV